MEEFQPLILSNLYSDRFCSHSVHHNFSCAKHINFETEFVIVLEGCLRMKIEEKTYNLTKNEAIVVLPFESHSFSCDDGIYRVVMCSNAAIPALSEFLHDKFPVTRCFSIPKELRDYQDFFCVNAPERLGQIESQVLLAPLVAEFIKNCTFRREKPLNSTLFSAALKYVNEHFLYDISLGEVAKAISCHPVSLSRIFHATTELSFSEYVTLRRCYYAKELLESTDIKITDLAFMAGFGSTRNFNRCFKKIFSVPPLAYRKTHAK